LVAPLHGSTELRNEMHGGEDGARAAGRWRRGAPLLLWLSYGSLSCGS